MTLRVAVRRIPDRRKSGMQIGRDKVLVPLRKGHIRRDDYKPKKLDDKIILVGSNKSA